VSTREKVARAIYHAAFMPANEEQATRRVPSPGWCWERTSEDQRQFALRQADAALGVIYPEPVANAAFARTEGFEGVNT
jgi:hypothetical protein